MSYSITTQFVKIATKELELDAYLAIPQGEGTFPGIVVLQEIFGVNAHIREVTEKIAKEGYIAIAPALYQRVAPGFETGYSPEDIKLGKYYKDQTRVSELLADVQSAIDYLKKVDQIKSDKVGTIGFCFGGHVVYLAATLPDIKVSASFYGAGIPTMTFGEGDPTITVTPNIKGKIFCFFGDDDPSIPLDHVAEIKLALQKHNIPSQVLVYQAQHGFFCDHRASYNQTAALNAWEKVKELFSEL